MNEEQLNQILEEIHNNETTELDLSGNRGISCEQYQKIAEALENNQTVKKFDLNNNLFGYLEEDTFPKVIARPVDDNQTDADLDFGDSYIEPVDHGIAKAIAKILKTNKTITDLNLGNNGIFDQGAEIIAEALKINQTIVNINFEGNEISNKGAKAIAAALLHQECAVEKVITNNQEHQDAFDFCIKARTTYNSAQNFLLGTNPRAGKDSPVRILIKDSLAIIGDKLLDGLLETNSPNPIIKEISASLLANKVSAMRTIK
jgi:hypothetical protein